MSTVVQLEPATERGWLDQARVRFVAAGALGVAAVLLVLSFATADQGRTIFGPPLGADFAGFYTAGALLNRPAVADQERLYDFAFQDELYHRLLPNLPAHEKLPFVHPPFIALAFRALALMPYSSAFGVWLAISAALYLAGLALVWKTLIRLPATDRLTPFLLALSFEPFLMECWLGGQLSSLGFCCVALAWYWEHKRRPFASGLALGLCLYKPTLLVVFLPMLLVGRRFRTLLGCAVTGLTLAAISWFAVGPKPCLDYAGVLTGFARATQSGGLEIRLWKYADLNSFLRLWSGGGLPYHGLFLAALFIVPLTLLARGWWRGEQDRRLLWAATVTCTLVINLYVGIYDTSLVVLGVLLTADVLAGERSPGFDRLLVLLYVIPWLTQPVARATGLQAYTIVLAAMAVFQFFLGRQRSPALFPATPAGLPQWH